MGAFCIQIGDAGQACVDGSRVPTACRPGFAHDRGRALPSSACGAVAVAVGVPAELDDELHPLARAIATALAAIARLTGTPLDAGNLAVLMRPPNLRTVYVLLPS